jgi:hypothetical protein
MHRMLAASIIAIVDCVAAGAVRAQDVGERDYSGEYVMSGKGFDPADSAYTGTCSVKPGKHAYHVSCFNVGTKHTYSGHGIGVGDTFAVFIGDTLKGDHNQVFAGEYLVVYRREASGVLSGVWVHAESRAAGAETLTPRN